MLNACKGNLLAAPLPWISIVHGTCYVMHIIAFFSPTPQHGSFFNLWL
jgi:hypothetical protein